MSLRGHVFSKQLFSSDCFALFIDTFLGSNSGIVKGCELSNTANSINLEKGFFCVNGRFLEEEGGSTFEIEAVEQDSLFCKLICEIDLSKKNTASELKQAYYRIIQAKNDYPTLQQDDVSIEGNIYQLEFARFKITTNGIEEFEDKRTFLDFDSFYSEVRRDVQDVLDEITAQKNDFFDELDITTKAEADALIKNLKEYCDSVKEVLDGDVVVNLYNKIIENVPTSYTLTIQVEDWTQNEETQVYEYNVVDSNITKDHSVDGKLHLNSQGKLGSSVIKSYNGGYKVKATELPTESVTMDIVIMLTNPVSTGGEEV